jgi:hypothetical protein
MVNNYEFNKQFSNIGIDKESIMNIGKENKDEDKKENNKMNEKEESQEIMLIKRKLDYLQNNIIAKINERFEEIEKKIDTKKNDSVELNREFTAIKNDISDLKNKISSVRIVFGEEEVTNKTIQKENNISKNDNKSKNSSNIKVEDYFNFSNKKFD